MLPADVSDIDKLAEALKVDGVVIDSSMGSGQAVEVHDRIATIVKETPFPVYVAMVNRPAGISGDGAEASEALASLLHRRIGGKGVYIVDTPDSLTRIVSYGFGVRASLLSLSASADADLVDAALERANGGHVYTPRVMLAEAWARQAEELVQVAGEDHPVGEYPSTLTDETVAEIVEFGLPLAQAQEWRPEVRRFVEADAPSKGWAALVGGLSGLVVALLLGQTLRGWPRSVGAGAASRTDPVDLVPDLDTERALAVAEVERLAQLLADLDWSKAERDAAQQADQARVAASHLLDSTDVADLVGARALAAVGTQDVRRAVRHRGVVLHPCFFDPRHGDGADSVSWRLGDGAVEVLCCTSCRKAVHRMDERPDVVHVPGRRAPRPYFERDDVWARTGFGALTDTFAADVLAAREDQR